ncbi:MAG: tetratricopeptide repeat protein [Bdellovibrionota bacterium]
MDLWSPILEKINLSRTEKEVVNRFRKDPQGRSFLPVADILKRHQFVDESIELLTRGVLAHKTFTVARVVLVRELYNKGLIVEAWKTLEQTTSSLKQNILAQKLKFKLAIALGYNLIAASTIEHMKIQNMLDEETTALGETFETSGIYEARKILINQWNSQGVQIDLPAYVEQAPNVMDADKSIDTINEKKSDEFPSYNINTVKGFQVVRLEEIFHGEDTIASDKSAFSGIELDSTTLAEIYENQGHYDKSIAVYRRLLRVSPSNEFLQNKIRELARKSKEQKLDDLTIDPSIADSMEQIEMIDVEIRFFESLLERLGPIS